MLAAFFIDLKLVLDLLFLVLFLLDMLLHPFDEGDLCLILGAGAGMETELLQFVDAFAFQFLLLLFVLGIQVELVENVEFFFFELVFLLHDSRAYSVDAGLERAAIEVIGQLLLPQCFFLLAEYLSLLNQIVCHPGSVSFLLHNSLAGLAD